MPQPRWDLIAEMADAFPRGRRPSPLRAGQDRSIPEAIADVKAEERSYDEPFAPVDPLSPRLPPAEPRPAGALPHSRRSRAQAVVDRGKRSIIRPPTSDRGLNPSALYILATASLRAAAMTAMWCPSTWPSSRRTRILAAHARATRRSPEARERSPEATLATPRRNVAPHAGHPRNTSADPTGGAPMRATITPTTVNTSGTAR